MTDTREDVGAERVVRHRRHGLGWLPWVALLLLVLLALLTYLILQNVNDNNDEAGIDVTDDESAVTATSPGLANEQTSGAAQLSSLTTGDGTDVFALAQSGDFGSINDQAVTATGVRVNSVVADEGFWVGDDNNQVFVHLSEAARGTGESAVQVAANQNVSFVGTTTPVPTNVSTLGVAADEGAAQLTSQGGYIEATSFRIAN